MYLASKTNYLNLFSWAGEGREEGGGKRGVKKDDGRLLVLHLHLHLYKYIHT